MSVEFSYGGKFEHSYEKEAIDLLINNMYSRFNDKKGLCLVLANYTMQGKQIDVTVLKKDGIFVIELKKCDYPLNAYENKDWSTINGEIIGMQGMNPYRQVMEYKNLWVDLLRKEEDKFECLKKFQTEQGIRHVKGIVAIYPFFHKSSLNHIPRQSPEGKNINWWFKLCGIDELDKLIESETYKGIDFSDDELRFIATDLLSMENPKVFQPIIKGNLLEKIRKNTEEIAMLVEKKDEEMAKISKENERLRTYARKKENEILSLNKEIERLKNSLQDKDVEVKKMEDNRAVNEEKMKNENEKRFQMITNHVISNYIRYLDKEKATNLVKLSDQFGIKQDQAVEIFNKIYKAAKTKK